MTTRLLPRAEWDRLAESDLGRALPLAPGARVLVCENETGDILGHLALIPLWHVEGAYVAPAHRDGAVLSTLIAAMHEDARNMDVSTLFPAAATASMAHLIQRLGGVEIPARWFALAVQEA